MLMEHETAKLKEQEEEYNRELKEWRSQLKPRKQVSAILDASELTVQLKSFLNFFALMHLM